MVANERCIWLHQGKPLIAPSIPLMGCDPIWECSKRETKRETGEGILPSAATQHSTKGCQQFPAAPTPLAGIVHQDDLGEQAARGAGEHAVHGAQQGAPGLVVEHDDHTGVWELLRVHFGLAPAKKKKQHRRKKKK